jgi:hypothetical protein
MGRFSTPRVLHDRTRPDLRWNRREDNWHTDRHRALTTREVQESEVRIVGGLIVEISDWVESKEVQQSVRHRVRELWRRFPLYGHQLGA